MKLLLLIVMVSLHHSYKPMRSFSKDDAFTDDCKYHEEFDKCGDKCKVLPVDYSNREKGAPYNVPDTSMLQCPIQVARFPPQVISANLDDAMVANLL